MSSRMLTSASEDFHPTQPIEQLRQRFNRLSGSTRKMHRVEPKSLTHVDVILGSLTATSEELAFSLVQKARQHGAEVAFESLHNFNPDQLVGPASPYRSPSRLVVFVMSTHMAGRPSSNAESFLLWLQQKPADDSSSTSDSSQRNELQESDAESSIEPSAPSDSAPSTTSRSPQKHRNISPNLSADPQPQSSSTTSSRSIVHLNWRHPFGGSDISVSASRHDGPMCGVQYTVFGVGNSIYRTYNATAKYVDARLYELGAMRVFPLGLGDASKWIDVTFTKWEAQLLHLISGPRSASEATRLESPEATSTTSTTSTSSTRGSSDHQLAEQEVTQGPKSEALNAPKQKKNPPLTRSSSFAKLLLRRRSTLDPSPVVVLMPSLPALK